MSHTIRQAYVDFVENELTFAFEDKTDPTYKDCIKELQWQEERNHFPSAVDTYKYIKVRRKELVQLEHKLLDLCFKDDKKDEDNFFSFTETDSYKKYSSLHEKVEMHLHKMDQKYMHKIVDLIPYMWT